MSVLIRDVILIIVGMIERQDIIAFGLTCWTYYGDILENDNVWYTYIVTHWPEDLPPVYKGFNVNSFSWRQLMLVATKKEYILASKPDNVTKLIFEYICAQLCKMHLRPRLEIAQSSKQYLRIFASVSQTGENVSQLPPIILNSKEIDYANEVMVFEFTHKDGSFMYWKGEGNIRSNLEYYIIDRMSNPVKVPLHLLITLCTKQMNKSTLSRKNYAFVGELLHKNPQHYESVGSIDYNWNTSHSYHRSGNAPTGFASNTNNITMPDIGIDSITRIVTQFNAIELYRRFILYETPARNE